MYRLALLLAVVATAASAQEIAVTTDDDEFGENPAACSLREAVQAANTAADFGGCIYPGANPTIRLEADRYRFTRAGALEDANATGDLDLLVPLTISGSTTGETTINGRRLDRVIHVHGVAVTIQHARIRDGRAFRDEEDLNGLDGGGILATDADLTLTDLIILDNRAGDGARESPGGNGGNGGGLALLGGSATITDVRFENNRAGDGGEERDNDGLETRGGDGGHGGAIYAIGTVVFTDGEVTDNRAGNGGSGGLDGEEAAGGSGGHGGGLWVNGSPSLTRLLVRGNAAGDGGDEAAGSDEGAPGGGAGHGGGLYVLGGATLTEVDLLGNRSGAGGNGYTFGSGSASASGGDGGGLWLQGGGLSYERGTVENNTASAGGTGRTSGNGGGMHIDATGTVVLADLRIENNRTADGADERWDEEGAGYGGEGGGARIGARTIRVLRSVVRGNATGSGGDAEEYAGRGGQGGGLYTLSDSLLVLQSTFAGNTTGNAGTATDFGTGERGGDGAAIYARDRFPTPALVTVESSTFSGNTTGMGGAGGFGPPGRGGSGGALSSAAPVLIRNSTLVGNTLLRFSATAPLAEGGGIRAGAGATVENSIVAGNRSGDTPDDCAAPVVATFLLTSPGTGCDGPGTLLVSPEEVFTRVLLPLADNGGPTPTHGLFVASPALDSGDCPSPSTDQRGFPRPVDDPNAPNTTLGCDIGAFEGQEGEVVVVDAEPTPEASSSLALTVAPNPSAGPASVTLRAEPGTRATIHLLDVRGRLVRVLHEGAVPADGLALETGVLPVGVYLVRALTDEEATTARLLVLR